jgi:hypothetical protein
MAYIFHKLVRLALFATAALALLIGPAVLQTVGAEDQAQVFAQCYNGVIPLNPYAQSCTLPSNQPQVRGAAPDAGAIIACRHHPGCLAWYVNNPR